MYYCNKKNPKFSSLSAVIKKYTIFYLMEKNIFLIHGDYYGVVVNKSRRAFDNFSRTDIKYTRASENSYA